MRRVTAVCVFLTTAILVGVADEVRADGYVTPWIGAHAVNRTDDGRATFGVTTGYMAGGIFGFEADVGYSSDFFGPSRIGEGYAINVMGDAILGVPIGGDHGAGIRPFVSGGLDCCVRTSMRERWSTSHCRATIWPTTWATGRLRFWRASAV